MKFFKLNKTTPWKEYKICWGFASQRLELSYWRIPANIRLDEDVLKTSFVFVFRRRLRSVLIKTNTFALVIRLQYILRRLAKMSSRHPQDVFNTFLRRTAKTVIYRKICLGHTSEKFMNRLQIFQEWTLWLYQNF